MRGASLGVCFSYVLLPVIEFSFLSHVKAKLIQAYSPDCQSQNLLELHGHDECSTKLHNPVADPPAANVEV